MPSSLVWWCLLWFARVLDPGFWIQGFGIPIGALIFWCTPSGVDTEVHAPGWISPGFGLHSIALISNHAVCGDVL